MGSKKLFRYIINQARNITYEYTLTYIRNEVSKMAFIIKLIKIIIFYIPKEAYGYTNVSRRTIIGDQYIG